MSDGNAATPSPGSEPGDSGAAASGSSAPLPQLVLELRDLVMTYVRQETLMPAQRLGRYVVLGLVGSVLLGIGIVLLGIGVLRLLQTEAADTFGGDWSWGPYGIVVVLWVLAAAVIWMARGAGREGRRER
jgi:hypothetical protein